VPDLSSRESPRTGRPPAEVERRLRTPDGTTLAYRLLPAAEQSGGPRRVLVLLHGVASNLTRWSEFVAETRLKASWDLLRLDLRGHGGSFTRGRIGLEIWCEDLLTVLEAERYERAVIAGHSLGAQVALHFAARRPGRTAGLVLIDPILREALRGAAVWLARLAPGIRLLAALIRALNRLGFRRRQIPARDLHELDETVRAALLARGRAEEFVARYTSAWEDLKYFPTAHYLQELVEVTRPTPPLATLAVPVLALLSRAVTFTDPARMRAVLATIPAIEIVDIEAYHWPLTERPAAVREAIEQWCEAHFGP
jgi:pimeloyl-ACP methyl ester carboxylesterase